MGAILSILRNGFMEGPVSSAVFFRIQGPSPLHDLVRLRHQVKLTCGRCAGAAAPRSRLRRVRAQEDETILQAGFSSHHLCRFVHLDRPGLIRSRSIEEGGSALIKQA